MNDITTADKFAIAQILNSALDNAIDCVDIGTAIDTFDRPLTPTAERYLRDLDGCETNQVSALFNVILGPLQEAFWGVDK